MSDEDAVWGKRGATLSDKSARKRFGLTQEQIIQAIKKGRLKYRLNYMHGNPWFRLIRKEVEDLAGQKHGANGLKRKKLESELAKIKTEMRSLKRRMTALRKREAELKASLAK